MAALSLSKWSQVAARLQKQHAAINSCEAKDLALAMGELWFLIQSAPRTLRDHYSALSEAEIGPVVVLLRNNLDDGRLGWQFTGDYARDALEIGAQMRALNDELAVRPAFLAATSPISFYYPTLDAFIIPRGKAKPLDRRPGPGNGFTRRGTPNHRILPRVLGETYIIELLWSPHFAFSVPTATELELGAALFPGERITWEGPRDACVASAAVCIREATIIQEHLDGAFKAPLIAAVWPELSMTDSRRKALAEGLSDLSLARDPLAGPTVVVAGSWHEKRNGQIVNLMRIFDKHGVQRLEFEKISRFVGGGLAEGNTPGNIIPVLINNDALVSFAVCSDFCVIDERVPYLDLDVDLILVASLGNENALNGHEHNAREHRTIYGSHTFLVQQHERNNDPLGWVLPRAGDPPSSGEDRSWSTRQISYS